MNIKMTFAEKVLQFYDELSRVSFDLPIGFKIMNPFNGDHKDLVRKITIQFYQKFYNDVRPRRLILGSSPSRRASGVTGIPFEETKHLREAGIIIDKFYVTKSSSGFLYDVMREYGGCKKFYSNFYMNFVCPLSLVKINSKGNKVNFNYYESKELQDILYPFIINTIQDQIDFGIDTSICYCIGSGGNYTFLSKINEKYDFFDEIVPLEHPRYIMQYHSKDKVMFMDKYLNALYKS
ncbi:MAG: uracil-DNA glycosylase family protein [Pseudomonadota bacterium]